MTMHGQGSPAGGCCDESRVSQLQGPAILCAAPWGPQSLRTCAQVPTLRSFPGIKPGSQLRARLPPEVPLQPCLVPLPGTLCPAQQSLWPRVSLHGFTLPHHQGPRGRRLYPAPAPSSGLWPSHSIPSQVGAAPPCGPPEAQRANSSLLNQITGLPFSATQSSPRVSPRVTAVPPWTGCLTCWQLLRSLH